MSATEERVFIRALSLPSRTRAALVQRLLVSLDQDNATAEIEEAWDREAKHRYDSFRKGRIKARTSAQVMRDAYAKVK
jgi:putative addiction module component (TIGR02574 family)